jgi:AcrR family transcriptional regulator
MTETFSTPRIRTRNRRGEGDRLRDELIIAATEVIADTGDANSVSLRGLARRLGIAAPSIYRHFRDVDELKLAVVERAFAEFVAQRDQARGGIEDPDDALRAGCRAYCRFAVTHPGPYRFMFSHDSPARGRQSPIGLAAFEALAASIRRCQESGASSAPEDAHQLAANVWAALHGIVLLHLNLTDFDWPDSLEERIDRTVERLVALAPGRRRDERQRAKEKRS